MSRRTKSIGNVIRRIVAEAIQTQLNDPRIETFTSVTRVDVTEDLSIARVHVSVMANETRRKLTLDALRSCAGRLRRDVRKGLSARQIPMLEFYLDESIQRAAETVDQLDRLMEEQRRHTAESTEEPAEGSVDAAPGATSEESAASERPELPSTPQEG